MRAAVWSLCFLCAAACGPQGSSTFDVELRVAGEPAQRESPFDFGKRLIGRDTTATLELINRTAGELALDSVAVDGAFSVTQNKPTRVPRGARHALPLTFHPIALGPHTAELLINSTPYTLNATAVPDGCEFPSTLDFGQVPLGTVALILTAAGTNALDTPRFGPLGVITPLGVFGTTLAGPVAAGRQRTVDVFFNPPSAGPFTATLKLRPFDECEEQLVTLTGEGRDDALIFDTTGLDFSYVPEGLVSTRRITITNPSPTEARLRPPNLSGSPELRTPQTEDLRIPPRSSATLAFQCAPTSRRGFFASARIEEDAPNTARHEVALICHGGGADIDLSPSSWNFGLAAFVPGFPAQRQTRTVALKNLGTLSTPRVRAEALHLGSIRVVPTNTTTRASEFQLFLPPDYDAQQGLDADGSTLFATIGLTPDSAGDKAADIFLSSNDVDEPELRIHVEGKAIALSPCTYSLSATVLDFGRAIPGETRTVDVGVTNLSTTDCLVSDVRLSPDSSPVFTVSVPAPQTILPAGATLPLTVRYAPDVAGTSHGGTVEVQLSSTLSSNARITLTGESLPSCLRVTPEAVRFGDKGPSCSALMKGLDVRNFCDHDVFVSGAYLLAGSGQFRLKRSPVNVRVQPGIDVVHLDVELTATATGAHRGTLAIDAVAGMAHERLLVDLEGTVSTSTQRIDTFTQGGGPTEVLFLVDNATGWDFNLDPQVELGARAAAFMEFLDNAQVDYHVGVTRYLVTASSRVYAAGELWTNPFTPEPFLFPSTLNKTAKLQHKVLMPPEYGDHHGNAAVLGALTPPLSVTGGKNAGFLRPNARLAIIYASEVTGSWAPQPISAQEVLLRLRSLAPAGGLTLHSFTYVSSPDCSGTPWQPTWVSAPFENAWLAAATGGTQSDSCPNPNGNVEAARMAEQASGFLLHFPLSHAAQAATPLEVRVNGQPATGWSHDAATNTVVFPSIAAAPPKGASVELRYAPSCP